ncbi:FAD-dependent oxidoreductase [Lentzea sp. NPDC055074]
MNARQVVVVGHGMAGSRVASEVRLRDPMGERVALTVVGAEPHPAYNRVLLSTVLSGALKPDEVTLQDSSWASDNAVSLLTGVSVVRVDRSARRVELSDGRLLPYDALVLATGSTAWIPPTQGLVGPDGSLASGVVPFRTVDDCASILSLARPGAPVAVLGGGLLGLEAARNLAGRGSSVTVVHPVGHLMERQLDPVAGAMLATTLGSLGIEFRLGRSATSYVPGDGLVLDDGTVVPAEVVVVSAGVRPEVSLAVRAGISVDRGVVVDDALRTSDPRVYALGDCAQHRGAVSGLVQPAWEQAAVVADLVCGTDPASRYAGTPVVTRLKARGVELTALGDVHDDSPDLELLRFEDARRGRYAKLVLRSDRVVGAIMLGAPDAAALVTQLYDSGSPAPEDRLSLLLGRSTGVVAGPADLAGDAVVCRCNTVSKAALVTAWESGATSVPAMAGATRATTGCGGCKDAVTRISEWLASRQPA